MRSLQVRSSLRDSSSNWLGCGSSGLIGLFRSDQSTSSPTNSWSAENPLLHPQFRRKRDRSFRKQGGLRERRTRKLETDPDHKEATFNWPLYIGWYRNDDATSGQCPKQ
jgi:hypothetical protein